MFGTTPMPYYKIPLVGFGHKEGQQQNSLRGGKENVTWQSDGK